MKRVLPFVAGLLAWLVPAGCAYNATGVTPPKILIFEFSVETGPIVQSPNIGYYFVIDTDKDPNTKPLVNGSAPLTRPYPDPYSYLPFVRDQRDAMLLDRDLTGINFPATTWTTFYALFQDAGQMVMYQGRVDASTDPTQLGNITERARLLTSGREWGITNNGKTVQITQPFNQIMGAGQGVSDVELPATLDYNLCVGIRGQAMRGEQVIIERWGRVPNFSLQLETNPVSRNIYDTVSGVTFPNNVPAGLDQGALNLTTISYRVVAEGQ